MQLCLEFGRHCKPMPHFSFTYNQSDTDSDSSILSESDVDNETSDNEENLKPLIKNLKKSPDL